VFLSSIAPNNFGVNYSYVGPYKVYLFDMFKFSLKTKISFYVSCAWLIFAFFVATTYSKLNNQIIVSWFDFYNVYWHIFFIVGIPVWLYWIAIRPYKWINKMRSNSKKQ